MKPYNPNPRPFRPDFDYTLILDQLLKTKTSVSKFDGMLEEKTINKDLFLNPIVKKEAVLSSKIEGTQATLTELLDFEADTEVQVVKTKYDDFVEIKNYNNAIAYAEEELTNQGKISLWLIRSIHRILLSGARGEDMNPGEFRKTQNWIGKPGSGIEKASFIPVAPEKLDECLEEFEKYMSEEAEYSPLVQAAIIHVQFEKIHPFKDGNGRIGRMLVPLFLYNRGEIERPVLYVSEYFDQYRDEYYDKLSSINNEDGWIEWILFFLKAIESQANGNIERIRGLQELYENYKIKINETVNSPHGIYIIDAIFANPIFKIKTLHQEISKKRKISVDTVARYVNKLVEAGIVKAEPNKVRNIKYYFEELINKIQ